MGGIDVVDRSPGLAPAQGSLDAAGRLRRAWEDGNRAAVRRRFERRVDAVAATRDAGASRPLAGALPPLAGLALRGAGVDGLDTGACPAGGIFIARRLDGRTSDGADLVTATGRPLRRPIPGTGAWVRSSTRARRGRDPIERRDIGRRAGIPSPGRIGAAIAPRLAALDSAIACSTLAPRAVPSKWSSVPEPEMRAARAALHIVPLAGTPRAPRVTAASEVLPPPHRASGAVAPRRALGRPLPDGCPARVTARPPLTPVA